jgi:hypothetical protein
MDYEVECQLDLVHGNGFLIENVAFSDTDKSIANISGPRSPLFGTTYSDNNSFADRYRCECGKFVGAVFEDQECPTCRTRIEFRDVDILYTGWMNFYPYKLINPLLYHKLQSALSKAHLDNIIGSDSMITSAGVIRRYDDEIEVKKKFLKYHNIGLHAFYENFEEVMLYYKKDRKSKAALFDQLIDMKYELWTSKIPIINKSALS